MASRKTSKKSSKQASAAEHVRIRMYNVGFGDSFLLTFPAAGGERRVLIDCGVHMSGPGPKKIRDVARQIIKDVTDENGARIDVVIATHRHADHVSGFDLADWTDVTVHEVWMPWTENYDDPTAVKILNTQSKAAKKLTAQGKAKGASKAAAKAAEIVQNSLVNAAAMKMLHEGFKGEPVRRFLSSKEGGGKQTFKTDHLPGVQVHVLGPSRDPDVIGHMDPPLHHSYLRAVAQEEELEGKPLRPFADLWTLTPDRYAKLDGALVSTHDAKYMQELSESNALALASSIEGAVNGTSLMLMFEVGDAYLLFPGDAQWGTWEAALRESGDLLQRTTFYKVGHHGSHNATPTDFVEALGDTPALSAAMVCTRAETKNWDIPRMPLLDRLKNITPNVARSDDEETPAVFVRDVAKGRVDYEVAI